MARKHDNRYPLTLQGLSVEIKDEKDFKRALRLFNKKVQDDGLIKTVRDNLYYEKPTERRTRRKKMAKKRWLKKVEQMKVEGRWTHRD